MSEREALAEALGTLAVTLTADNGYRVRAVPLAALLASDALARLLADAEQRGAARVAAAVEALHGVDHWCSDDEGRGDFFMVGGETGAPWPCSTLSALATGAAERVRAEEGDQ